MSMPTLVAEVPDVGREDAISQIIATIALEEVGLSHILNAEGEKIQFALGTLAGTTRPLSGGVTIADLVALDNSVTATLQAAAAAMTALTDKLRVAVNADVDV